MHEFALRVMGEVFAKVKTTDEVLAMFAAVDRAEDPPVPAR